MECNYHGTVLDHTYAVVILLNQHIADAFSCMNCTIQQLPVSVYCGFDSQDSQQKADFAGGKSGCQLWLFTDGHPL